MKIAIPVLLILAMSAVPAAAQGPAVGNTLITPLRSTETFLIDIDLNTLQTWHGDNGAGHTVYLLPDMSVLRGQGDPNGFFGGGGSGGHLQRIDEGGNVVWDYFFSNENHQQHHDIEPMPNGNVLIIAWEVHTVEEAIAAGRTAPTNGDLWTTYIVELEPVGSNDANIVWEWRIWDHIIQDTDSTKPNYGIISEHPERVDVNLGNVQRSWDHANYIDYDPVRDEIIYSARRMNEVYVIDHSTTTEEAAGHTGGQRGMGGDLLYRWGNPQNYGRGLPEDQVFWGVHGANFIDAGLPGAGGILAFNNGNREGDANDESSVVEIRPPIDQDGNYVIEPDRPFGPSTPHWVYSAGRSFYSLRYGSAYRMPNGNTLICEGVEGFIFEVTEQGARVWAYVEPIGNGVFAAQRYFDVPLPVFISHFDAIQVSGGIDLAWDISADEPVAGFRIYRAEADNAVEHRLGERMIPPSTRRYTDPSVRPGVRYRYTLVVVGSDGSELRSQPVDIEAFGGGLALLQNHPNPFNPATSIRFSLPERTFVTLRIFDVEGKLVTTLVDRVVEPGPHEIEWTGRDGEGLPARSGVYFYRLEAGDRSLSRKMVLLK